MEDQQIIEKLQSDETASEGFAMLTKLYSERIYWHIRKMVIDHDDADDLTQEVFIKIWTKRNSFRGDSGIFTWIYRIATNESLNFLKKKKRRSLVPMDEINRVADQLADDPLLSGEAIQLKLQQALVRLPEKQRLVFNMKYFDEMKFHQISEITNTSVGALKASYHHAVKKIEEILNND